MAANKLIYSWNQNQQTISPDILSSYAESLIFDGEKRTIWHKGHQYGNTYYGSRHGESFNDFSHNTANGEYSHAEGTFTTASGIASHAEGYKTYAAGDCTTVSGMGTQAYNDNEAAFGKYNKSNTDNSKKTLFSIGDGISDKKRHNVIEVTDSYTYISNKSYLGDYLFGSLTYSYVDYTGVDKPMNLIVKALLNEAEYTKPTLYTKFAYVNSGVDIYHEDKVHVLSSYSPSYISGEDITRLKMEVGTYFYPCVIIYWPDPDEDIKLASVMSRYDHDPDYETIPSYRTGYSYGLDYSNGQPIRYKYNDGNNDVKSNITNTPLPTSTQMYINSERDFTVISDITLRYRESSHMLYEQLKRVGLYQISYGYDKPYFEGGIINVPQKLIVEGRYLWYAGLTDTIPASKNDMLVQSAYNGFLDKLNDYTTYSYGGYTVNEQDIEKKYFWIACPENFELSKYNSRYTVNLCRGNAINYDLTTDAQTVNNKKLNTSTINNVPLGMNNINKNYTVYYIKLNATQLADGESDVIRFKFVLKDPNASPEPEPETNQILVEGGDNAGKALETEDVKDAKNILYE